jgi:hypothetical protein
VDTFIVVPAPIADLGDQANWRYVEFFTANINNDHTRRAYARACRTAHAGRGGAHPFLAPAMFLCLTDFRVSFDDLDLNEAGFARVKPKDTSRPGYDPADLLKLLWLRQSGALPAAGLRPRSRAISR